jgi:uncharacterized phage protein gp47/JayE
MFENLTYELILQRMLDRVPSDVDKQEGSVIFDALAPAAFELMQFYISLSNVLDESFADTASRANLIRLAAERGLTPGSATRAVLRGVFIPAGIDVMGRRFSMMNSTISYEVTRFISAGVYEVTCETAGTAGNQQMGALVPIDYIQGLEAAELTALLIPAQDEETTEHLRGRYFDTFGNMAFGGNVKDYIDKTTGIDGVGAVKVFPIWNGGGTVKLTILDAQFNKASDILVDRVQTITDPTQNNGEGAGLAPIGHVVTVETVAEVAVNIQTAVILDSGTEWSQVEARVIEAVQDYLLELRKNWKNEESLVVRTAQIDTRILSVQGILDVAATKINGSAENLMLAGNEIPVFGGIIV